MNHEHVTVIGGGLAGSEAAWQAAERGLRVSLYEMRPAFMTGAHAGDRLAELVCSNSLGSALPDRAPGILLNELERADSLLITCARETSVPAGGALAVDRLAFSEQVTERIHQHPRIRLIRDEVKSIPAEGLVIVAAGPLASPALSESIRTLTGADHLYFFDALSPIVETASIDFKIAFKASRYGRGTQAEGDYINCPMNEVEYDRWLDALRTAERIPLRAFEALIEQGVKAGLHRYFESCLPIEVMAKRGRLAPAFGPLRPVGLTDPRTGRRPFAAVQLRQEDRRGEYCNLVGFQTNLRQSEQARVFRLIPGLGKAVFTRYGQMHRNTFINAPRCLHPTLQFKKRDTLFFAGQIAGVEGYLGNIATGLLAGRNAARQALGHAPETWPLDTMLGALCHAVCHADPEHFQPIKANFGLLPPLTDNQRRGKRERAAARAERAAKTLHLFLQSHPPRPSKICHSD